MPTMNYAQAINSAMHQAMADDPTVICYGLGVGDPKAVFGTVAGLQERFGADRAFEMPTSENAMTGIAVGAALGGLKPVMVHQRLDFFLLAMDQLVNAAAKWHYTFGPENPIPITIRLIVGRGWGQGPTHSQNLQAWFAHIPGLKVVAPTTPEDARGLLLSAIHDPNPVVFLEHRWLHNGIGDVPDGDTRIPIGVAKTLRGGTDLTIVAQSFLTAEALRAADYLASQGIHPDIIDLRTVKPIDWDCIHASVERTGRLLVLDPACATGSVAGEIIARVAMERFSALREAPVRVAMPDVPEATSFSLTRDFYPGAREIAIASLSLLGKSGEDARTALPEAVPHDVPGPWFKGPF
ncbi:MAG: alpha-ketoacid dehydrogenase subunit beta [Bacteroidota bacterium]